MEKNDYNLFHAPPPPHSRHGGHTVGISIYLWLLFQQNSAPDQQKKKPQR